MPANVQSTTGSGNGANYTLTLTGTTAGNMLLVAVANNSSAVSTPTGFSVAIANQSLGAVNYAVFYKANITGGSQSASITVAGGAGSNGIMIEYSGLDTTTPLDKTSTNTGAGGTPPTSGSTATTTVANEMVVGIAVSSNTDTQTLGTGFSNLISATVINTPIFTEDKTVSSTGTQSAAFGSNATFSWGAAVATFKSSAVNVNVSDTIGSSENLPVNLVSLPLVSDSTTLTDTVSYYSDLVATSESINVALFNSITVSDTIGSSEFIQLQVISYTNVSDTIGTTENLPLNVVSLPKVSDTIGSSENIVISPQNYIAVSDTVGSAESITMNLHVEVNVFDSIHVSEALALNDQDPIMVMDSFSVTDTPIVSLGVTMKVSDSTSGSENIKIALPTPNAYAALQTMESL